IFDFVSLSAKRRKTFVTRGINNEFIRKLNNKSDYYKFEDKIVFNTLFDEFVGREWLYLKKSTPSEFAEFLDKHGAVIAKPTDSICGKGIEKVTAADCDSSDLKSVYDRLIANNQLLTEEYIVQHEDLSRLHPESVNTLRFMTIVGDGYSDNKPVHVMFRALRVGSGGNVVDNFNSGGMFVLVDEDGTVSTHAINKNTEMYESHPETGVTFKGYKIPFFHEAEEMVREAALVVAGIRYVSWDVAVTPDGVVLVEGNHNPGYDLLQSKAYLETHEYGRLADFREVIY
ncbi:MAG: hypothetical protein FWF82_03440, partial [Oscillospiraceae bacterium]|nr:hypothetical protein [Oscillospiraceae bacterium]